MPLLLKRSIPEILERAKERALQVLPDPDAFAVVEAIGIAVPRQIVVRGSAQAAGADLSIFPGDRIVVKVMSERILHRTDVGGVAVVPKRVDDVVAAVGAMEQRLAGWDVSGYTLNEFVPFDATLGGELLLGARWTDDFGPVVTFGPGGIYAEFLSGNLRTGRGATILSPVSSKQGAASALRGNPIAEVIAGRLRHREPRIAMARLEELVDKVLRFAADHMPDLVSEFEMNPVVLTERGPVALDVLLKPGRPATPPDPDRPLWKLGRLLRPGTIGIIGVSEKMNPGHIILRNIIRDGFDPAGIRVIKPGRESIDGCRCYPDIASLPEPVDLLVLSIDAAQVPAVVEEVICTRKAESLIVIPGGMGERKGSEALALRTRDALNASRAEPWEGPIINGGNCLGILSRPGRYDTMFIPEQKLPQPGEPLSPLAVISQSGAFAISRASKLSALNPKYLISLGNQMDLTVGDYLAYLKDDPDIRLFACYVEGFRPLDGRRWLEAAAEIAAGGRTVILYRAGRTAAGARATASHTASIAGDYAVTRDLAEAAGVVVAETLNDFEDLTRLFCMLEGKRVAGWNLGALSNAGFECVAFADNLGRFRLPAFGEKTAKRIADLFARCRLGGIVDVHNPLDVTPIMDDEAFAEAARCVMEDDQVQVGVIGCVPLTGALTTLPASRAHHEDLADERSVVSRLIRLKTQLDKPWVAVVDGGAIYDPMALRLEDHGVPVLRSADRALRLLGFFCQSRLRART